MSDLYLEITFRYVHFVSIFLIFSSLAGEYIMLKPQMTRKEIHRLSLLDSLYGINALILLFAGLSLWLWLGKPAEFYTKNWIFHVKLTLYIIVAILSIYPTVFFLKKRKGNKEELVEIPPKIKFLIRMELLILLIIPILAGLMSKGIGFSG